MLVANYSNNRADPSSMAHYSNYDSYWLTSYTQDRQTNYFGRLHASNYSIANDMGNDS
jgi:hypothetical protein